MQTGIETGMLFTEWEAAHQAGLDLYQWEQGLYPVEFKARVIAWYHLHQLVSMHQEAAASEAAARKSKA